MIINLLISEKCTFRHCIGELDSTKRKRPKSKSKRSDDPDAAAAREDDAKQKLFDAFEQQGPGGAVTLQDMVKITGQSQHFLKGLIEQIAVPIRGGEQKRASYALRPEFQCDSNKRTRTS